MASRQAGRVIFPPGRVFDTACLPSLIVAAVSFDSPCASGLGGPALVVEPYPRPDFPPTVLPQNPRLASHAHIGQIISARYDFTITAQVRGAS
jgi:hypothetical protein